MLGLVLLPLALPPAHDRHFFTESLLLQRPKHTFKCLVLFKCFVVSAGLCAVKCPPFPYSAAPPSFLPSLFPSLLLRCVGARGGGWKTRGRTDGRGIERTAHLPRRPRLHPALHLPHQPAHDFARQKSTPSLPPLPSLLPRWDVCLVATIGGEGGAFKGGQKVRSRSGLGVGLERNADAGLGGTRKKRRALLGGELLSGEGEGTPPRVRLFGCLRLIAFLSPSPFNRDHVRSHMFWGRWSILGFNLNCYLSLARWKNRKRINSTPLNFGREQNLKYLKGRFAREEY